MNDHVKEWLGAFHDGELHGARLRQVEVHLAMCAACQAELESIESLSMLLQENDPQAVSVNPDRFAANLALRLPRQLESTQANHAVQYGWWLIPVGLLAAWLFISITGLLSSIVILTANIPLFSDHMAWLQTSPVQMEWFAATMNLFGNRLGDPELLALYTFNEANVVISWLLESLIPQIILSAAYLGWLLAWWLGHSDQHDVNFRDLDLSNGS